MQKKANDRVLLGQVHWGEIVGSWSFDMLPRNLKQPQGTILDSARSQVRNLDDADPNEIGTRVGESRRILGLFIT